MILSYWDGPFSRAFAASFRECNLENGPGLKMSMDYSGSDGVGSAVFFITPLAVYTAYIPGI